MEGLKSHRDGQLSPAKLGNSTNIQGREKEVFSFFMQYCCDHEVVSQFALTTHTSTYILKESSTGSRKFEKEKSISRLQMLYY